jgi:hypothetical protein
VLEGPIPLTLPLKDLVYLADQVAQQAEKIACGAVQFQPTDLVIAIQEQAVLGIMKRYGQLLTLSMSTDCTVPSID